MTGRAHEQTKWIVLDKTREKLSSAALYRDGTGRPFVTVSYAQSLDGSIAAIGGRPLGISSAPSLELTHAIRASHQAILVGIGCVLADNPRLTVRLTAGCNPQPVIVDSDLRCPLSANLLTSKGTRPWIVTTDNAEMVRQTMLERTGAKVIRVKRGRGKWVDLTALLETLASLGVASLMVEGGAKIITSFLVEHLVNQVVVTVAPFFVGGLRAPDSTACQGLGCLPRLVDTFFERVGDDVVLRGDVAWDSR
ncbi:MAG: dihydrofolate reductase family protein [Syntrophales bacterium LBB04]|nr:dihydrofolate reductase family protein [Syntrophales bacterium LBB04]